MVRTRLNIGCRYSTPVLERPLHPTRSQFKPQPSQTQAPVTPATEPERRAGGGLTTAKRPRVALHPQQPFTAFTHPALHGVTERIHRSCAGKTAVPPSLRTARGSRHSSGTVRGTRSRQPPSASALSFGIQRRTCERIQLSEWRPDYAAFADKLPTACRTHYDLACLFLRTTWHRSLTLSSPYHIPVRRNDGTNGEETAHMPAHSGGFLLRRDRLTHPCMLLR